MNTRKGIIFNIQHFSLHDGPGIRTTVFLKGCPYVVLGVQIQNLKNENLNPCLMLLVKNDHHGRRKIC